VSKLKRRTDVQMSSQQLFREVHDSPLQWPWKTVRLERNSLSDYRQRGGSANVSVAELYHANTKLYPQMLSELAASRVSPDEVRREFVSRRGASVDTTRTAELDVDPRVRQLLTAVNQATAPTLFYAIELRLLVDDTLMVHEPVSDTLQVVKRLSPTDRRMLVEALSLMTHANSRPHAHVYLFVIGVFARNDVLFGARGYRRTLIEAGQVTGEILRYSEQLGSRVRPLYEFADHDVDAVLEVDGVEEGTLVACQLEGV
jgi:hypothetical protein